MGGLGVGRDNWQVELLGDPQGSPGSPHTCPCRCIPHAWGHLGSSLGGQEVCLESCCI